MFWRVNGKANPGPTSCLESLHREATRFRGLHETHPAKPTAAISERRDKIELFYLPSYSPELNPEERLNADLKYATGSKA